MPVTTDARARYPVTCGERHPDCWVCAPDRPEGLALRFELGDDNAVQADFDCREEFTGYPGFLHGGIVSSLLDGAMTHCLMARGTPGLTARLEVRFRHPVRIGRPVRVRGWWKGARGPMHTTGAVLIQEGAVVAEATARFMEYPTRSGEES